MLLVFLDLDGVICCNYRAELEASKLQQAQRVCSQTGAKVVLSSDWRRRPQLRNRACEALRNRGIDVIGFTPEYSMTARIRPREIADWLAEHGHAVTGFVAIDDRSLDTEEGGRELGGRTVLTSFGTGLTPSAADRAIRILKTMPWAHPLRPVAATESPGRPSSAAAPLKPLATLTALLLDAGMSHLVDHAALRDQSLRSLYSRLGADEKARVEFLRHLRSLGILALSDRQKLTNALASARRHGRTRTELAA